MNWCHCIVLLYLSLACRSTAGEPWTYEGEGTAITDPFTLPLTIADVSKPFAMEASLHLKVLDGTAASFMLGDQLNFGFDGRGGKLFLEGKQIGAVKTVGKSNEHIEAGKRFDFSVRSDGQQISFLLNQKEISRVPLRPPLGRLAFRPHRNAMTLHQVRVTGDLQLPEPFVVTPRQVPILNNGTPREILRVDFNESTALEKLAFDFADFSDRADLSSLLITKGDDVLYDGPAKAIIPLAARLGPGESLSVSARIRPDASLLNRVGIHLVALHTPAGVLPASATRVPPLRLARNIHQRGEHACHTFRIPGLARGNDGSLLAVYDMRYNSRRDLQEHMDIGLSRSTDGGETWADPLPIMDMGEFGGKPENENGVSDPCILVDTETGHILVAACWTHGKPGTHQWRGRGSEPGHEIHQSTQFMVVRSRDHGRSWSELENWTSFAKPKANYLAAPGPGNGITLRDGTLVMPTQGRDETGLPFSNIAWSKDRGKTWTFSPAARRNTTEAAVAELSDGSLLLNMRDNRNRSLKGATNGRAMGQTADLGASWTVHASDHGALPEPVCMASMIAHRTTDGQHLLLFSNPRNKQGRRQMTIQVSTDDGTSWEPKVELDEAGGAYSNLVMVDDETVGILYESSQADLLFQKLRLSELMK